MIHLSAGQDICLVHVEHNNTEIPDKTRIVTWTGQFSYEVTIGIPSLFKDMVAWEKCKLIFILQMDYFLLLLHLSFWSLWFFLLMVLWAHITTEFSNWFFQEDWSYSPAMVDEVYNSPLLVIPSFPLKQPVEASWASEWLRHVRHG